MFSITVDDEISLHLVQEHHYHDLFTLIDQNRGYIGQHMAYLAETKDEVHQLCLRSKTLFAESGALITAIYYHDQLAGMISVRDRTGGSISGAEIGYWLGEDFVGNGIITRATKTLTDYVFAHWDIQRVFLGITPQNKRSYAIAERLGFTLEGTIRNNDKINDEWVDYRIYAMLRGDWDVPQNPPILCYRLDDKLNMRLVEQPHAQAIFDVIDINRKHIGEYMPWLTYS